VKKKHAPDKGALSPPLAPSEWDFRKIPESQLEYAIYYEYARSCDWILKRFQQWHEQKLSFINSNRELSAWIGLTVGEALKQIQNCEPPFEVIQAVGPGPAGDEAIPPLTRLYLLNPLFPTAFLDSKDAASGIAQVAEVMPLNPTPPPFREVSHARELSRRHPAMKFAWDDPEFVKQSSTQGIRKFEIVLDLRYSKSRLKKEFGEWLDDLSDSGVQKFRIDKGQKARPKWSRLRELAAYRFFKAKISYSQAQDFLERYSAAKTSIQYGQVLPNYKSAGAWSDAIQSAERRVSELFPPPIQDFAHRVSVSAKEIH
jgi:hypothetical protein